MGTDLIEIRLENCFKNHRKSVNLSKVFKQVEYDEKYFLNCVKTGNVQ